MPRPTAQSVDRRVTRLRTDTNRTLNTQDTRITGAEDGQRRARRSLGRVARNIYDHLRQLGADYQTVSQAVQNAPRPRRGFGWLFTQPQVAQAQPAAPQAGAGGNQPPRRLRRPSWRQVGLVGLALGAAGLLGWGGNTVRNLPEKIYEGRLKRGDLVYGEGAKENNLKIRSGRYTFEMVDDEGVRTKIGDSTPEEFNEDQVDRVIVTRPGGRKVVYDHDGEGALYGHDRREFMAAADKCYDAVRGAIFGEEASEIQGIVDRFVSEGMAHNASAYEPTSTDPSATAVDPADLTREYAPADSPD
ncbi:MAG: hypothetical protein ABIH92_00155 [Nanoarchaeota archaeon]